MEIIAKDNQRVVVGLGMTGLSCARYFAKNQQPFSVVDSRDLPPGLDAFREEFPDIEINLGAITDDSLAHANELVVSPGVSLEEPAIVRAMDAGVMVCGDVDLFVREVSAPIVAITGSNGKSTVTTLVGQMAEAEGKRVAVGGNIGVPVLDLLDIESPDFYVLELSSFQLERSEPLNAEVATVLNMSPDHMDRYKSMVEYHQAKHKIFRGCKQVVINRADPLSKPLLNEEVKVWTFGLTGSDFGMFSLQNDEEGGHLAFEFESIMPVSDLKIVGKHNVENALAALAIGHAMGLSFKAMAQALSNFAGLPHRCQFVAEIAQVKYYNDSKGTNVGATVAAINGFADQHLVLIAGGDSKGASFEKLSASIKGKAKAVVLIGESAQMIHDAISDVVDCHFADSMDDAVAKAKGLAHPGSVVLLSPGCASFDMFDNYQHRGEMFSQSVLSLMSEVKH